MRMFPTFCVAGILAVSSLAASTTRIDEVIFDNDTGEAWLGWNVDTNLRYNIESAADIHGPWLARDSIVTNETWANWLDAGAGNNDAQFYRLRPVGDSVKKIALKDVQTWAYKIQGMETNDYELMRTHFDMYVIEPMISDPFTADFDITNLIGRIREFNKTYYGKDPLILAYIDVGQAENWRWYWQEGWEPESVYQADWVTDVDPNDWTGNYPVAYWYDEWYNICIYGTNGNSHLLTTLNYDFDGIYMDWVEGFTHEAVVEQAADEGIDATNEMFWLIEELHTLATNVNPDYLVVAQNAADLYKHNPSLYTQIIDGIALEAIWFDGHNEYDAFDNWDGQGGFNIWTTNLGPDYVGYTDYVIDHLEPLTNLNFPIFCVEYAQDHDGTNFASMVYDELAPQHGYIPYCSQRALSRLSTNPYPRVYTPIDY